jgi:hypothetical protein
MARKTFAIDVLGFHLVVGSADNVLLEPKDDRNDQSRGAGKDMAGTTGLEPAASAVTGQRSNQLNYVPAS